MSRLIYLIVALTSVVLAGCATQHKGGVEPVHPKPLVSYGNPIFDMDTVKSLQPLLSWKATSSGDVKFDLIVYTAEARDVFVLAGPKWYVPGIEIYYREGLTTSQHQLEKQLAPRTVYVWGVRLRQGDVVGDWSRYDFQAGYLPVKGLASQEGMNLWWQFRTPRE